MTLDSNNLDENWRENIDKKNPNSQYNWKRLDDFMRSHEDLDQEETSHCTAKSSPEFEKEILEEDEIQTEQDRMDDGNYQQDNAETVRHLKF